VLADTAKLAVNLSLEGNFSAGIHKAESDLTRLNSTVSKTVSKVGNDLGRGIRTTAQNLERLAFVAGGAVVAGIGAAVKVAGDFEAQMNTIATIVDRQDIPAIGEQLRETARNTGIALDDLTTGYYDLASAGVKGALATAALNDAVKLGIGGLATTAETVDLLTTAINAYGLDIAGAEKATNQFALAVADGKVKASEIAASFANVASIAKAYGVGIDQIAASYAFLTAQGVPAAEVTTELQRAIVSLINPSAELEAAQKKLGVSFGDQLKSGKSVAQVMQEIVDYSNKTGIPLNQLLGRVEAVKYALQTTGPEAAGFAAELKKMGNVGDVAAQQMAERQQGLNFQLAKLKANVKDAAITIGTELIPQVASLAGELADFLRGHQAEIKTFASDLATGFRDAVKWARSLDWQSIGNGLKAAAFFAKTLIQGFMNLPPGVKETLAGLYALNKLSGGAVVNIGVDITKGLGGGLFQQFLGRGSPANPMFVVAEGGLGGGPGLGGAGKPAGLLGTLAKGAVAVTVVGVTADAAFQISGINDPRHQTGDPAHPIMRGTNVPSEQLANLENVERALVARVAGGETGIVIKQLADVRAAITRLEMAPGSATAPGATGSAGMGYQRFTGYNEIFGAHATDFGLKAFRGSAAGAIDLFDERIKYLSNAQGSGVGSKQYLSVVARDITALKSLLPTATDKQKVAITSEIQTLEGILSGKKFSVTIDTLRAINEPAAVKKAADKASAEAREAHRIAKQTGTATKSAIDYAKVQNVRATDDATAAINASRDAIVRAILGLNLNVNITTATAMAKTAETVNRDNITTGSRLGGR
jgi:TP901 family phage tail tape measure protein